MMKRIIISILSFTLTLSLFAGIKGGCDEKDSKKAYEYEKYAEDYENQAKEALKKGQSAYAKSLQECAKAKRLISDGYKSGNKKKLEKGYKRYEKACKKKNKFESQTVIEEAAKISQKADEANKAGDKELSEALEELAETKRHIAKAMKKGDWREQDIGHRLHDAADMKKQALEAKKEGKDEISSLYGKGAELAKQLADAIKKEDYKEQEKLKEALEKLKCETGRLHKKYWCDQKKQNQAKNPCKANEYEKYANDYEKKAKKALEKGDQALAQALKQCATAKRKIAEGLKTGDCDIKNEGAELYKIAREKLDSLTKDKKCDAKKGDKEKSDTKTRKVQW